jgi:succinate dehydrogenase/fumarate reductase flavoprotein subunit
MKFEGKAAAKKKDAVVLTLGGQAFMVSAADSKVSLAKYWNTTEFNIFGDGNGSEANFGANTTLNAQTQVVGTSKKPPSCALEGFTAETNNLTLTATPALAKTKIPTMAAAQTNGTTTTASCATAG